ncbi:hypothetical protein [Streptosporangium sp. NPDC020145]|uniref:hypothetical protein n=1 Tax=Streptosporangium sp. NPDC020145 TaxID=3154694 RepID=UPI0034497EED
MPGFPPTKDCDDPEIKAWLLRYGFRNDIMNEYLAHLAATTGDLYSALLEAEVDDALLDGAGDILTALAQGGPAEDMDDYPDALPVIRRFAELLATRQATLGRLNSLLSVLAFLRTSPDDSPWAALSVWPEEAVPDQARDWVRRASAVEPDEGTRTEMLAFLRDR